MRKITFFFLPLLLATTAPAACSGNGETGTGGGAASSSSSASTSTSTSTGSSSASGAGGAMDGVTGTAKDLYQPSTGDVIRPNTTSWTTIEALVDQAGALKPYPGTIDAQGDISIPGVPVGPYLLALTSPPPPTIPGALPFTSFFATAARMLDLGNLYSGRPDLQSMTKPTYLTLQASLSMPWQVFTDDGMGGILQPFDDALQFVSRNGSVTGYFSAGQSAPGDNAPVDGAMQLAGWKINAQDAFTPLIGKLTLVEGSKGDDFTVLHDVMKQVGMPTPDGNPWNGYTCTSTQEALQPVPFTMTDGGTTTLMGAFQAVPQKSFAMDYKGAAFNALFAGVAIDTGFTNISLILEAGTPMPAIGAFATLVSVPVAPGIMYSNPDPACHGAGCDPMACPNGCDAGTMVLPGDHAHTYSYGNPFTFGQELVSVNVQFQKRVTTLLPEKTPERLRGLFYIQTPASEITGKPIVPVIGLPQNIKVAGKDTPYDQVTTAVGTSPTITWSAPSLGKPTHYRVVVVDLTDLTDVNNTPIRRRSVASIAVTSPSVSLPDGILKAGKYYSFEVTAQTQDSDDLAAPFKFPQHEAFATMFTGVVTP